MVVFFLIFGYLWLLHLAALIIAMLFLWHTQHKSDIGFITIICGVNCLQKMQKVEYDAAFTPASSADSLYSIHTAYSSRYVACVHTKLKALSVGMLASA